MCSANVTPALGELVRGGGSNCGKQARGWGSKVHAETGDEALGQPGRKGWD